VGVTGHTGYYIPFTESKHAISVWRGVMVQLRTRQFYLGEIVRPRDGVRSLIGQHFWTSSVGSGHATSRIQSRRKCNVTSTSPAELGKA